MRPRIGGIGIGLLGVALAACTSPPPVQQWQVSFADPDEELRSRHLRVFIARTCDSTHVYDADLPRDGGPAAMSPGELESGSWAFGAESIDVTCGVHARGCVQIDVPTDGALVEVVLEAVTSAPCAEDCPCTIAACCAADAGPPDDAGSSTCDGVVTDPACSTFGEGFTNCGTDTSCSTFTPVRYRVTRGGSTFGPECSAVSCGETRQLSIGPACACPGGCYFCERDADGNLRARVEETCGSPQYGSVVPPGSADCSLADGPTIQVECCPMR